MKTKPNVDKYFVDDDCIRINQAAVSGDLQIYYSLYGVSLEDLIKLSELNKSPPAAPKYFAHSEGYIHLYPTPDKEYELTVYYTPHMRRK